MFDKNRLVELRNRKGLYQKDVAKLLRIGRTTYVKYETGDIQPPSDAISSLAEHFEVTADYLLGLSDDPGPKEKAPVTDEDLKVAFWGNPDIDDRKLEKLREIAKIIEDE